MLKIVEPFLRPFDVEGISHQTCKAIQVNVAYYIYGCKSLRMYTMFALSLRNCCIGGNNRGIRSKSSFLFLSNPSLQQACHVKDGVDILMVPEEISRCIIDSIHPNPFPTKQDLSIIITLGLG